MTRWLKCLMVVDLDRGSNLASLVEDADWTAGDWEDDPDHPDCTLRFVSQVKRGPLGPTLMTIEVRYQEDPPTEWNWPSWCRLVSCTPMPVVVDGRVAA